jgi:hypothetical protein
MAAFSIVRSPTFPADTVSQDPSGWLTRQIEDLHGRTLATLRRAEMTGQVDAALKAIREARHNLELIGELTGATDRSLADVLQVAVIVPCTSSAPDAPIEIQSLR